MDARLFRYLFENTPNAVIMSGCIWDKGLQDQLRFVYTCEMNHNPVEQCHSNGDGSMLYNGSPIHMFIMGSFSLEDVKRLIYTVRHDIVDMVITPYVAPVQRFYLIQSVLAYRIEDPDIIEFIRSPYLYLKKANVKQFYFIYGNGKGFQKTEMEMYPGIYFEFQDAEILDIIEEMEGYRIPVMKAGHIINNRMLFQFGYFGTDLYRIRHFLFHYAKSMRIEKFDNRQIKKMMLAYRKAFSDCGMETLTMFCSPTEIIATQTDCVLNTIVIDKEDFCHADIEQDNGRCTVKCMLYNDYDVCHCHRTEHAELRVGILLLGNIHLSKHIQELRNHYQMVSPQIRAITLPNCGNMFNWDFSLTDMNVKKNAIFWICPLRSQMQSQVFTEIKAKNARYRIIVLNEEYGCCFNGFLTEKAE